MVEPGAAMSRKALTRIVCSTLVLLLILSLVLIFRAYQQKKHELAQNKIHEFEDKVDIILTVYRQVAQLVYDTHIKNTDIELLMWRAVYAENEEEEASIRNELFAKNKDIYQIITQYDFRQLHYHLPTTESFLRMHKPERYGDLLEDVRLTVRDANRNRQVTQGFEEGRILNGYRFVFPIFYKEEHVGSVEISVSIAVIIDNLKKLFGNAYHFIILKSIVDQTVFEEERDIYYRKCEMDSDYYIDVNAIDEDFI